MNGCRLAISLLHDSIEEVGIEAEGLEAAGFLLLLVLLSDQILELLPLRAVVRSLVYDVFSAVFGLLGHGALELRFAGLLTLHGLLALLLHCHAPSISTK